MVEKGREGYKKGTKRRRKVHRFLCERKWIDEKKRELDGVEVDFSRFWVFNFFCLSTARVLSSVEKVCHGGK